MTAQNTQTSTKTYLEDTVSLISDPAKLGVVTRTWHDVEDESALDDTHSDDSEHTALPRGHVQISFLDNSPPLVVHEDGLHIIDRSLHLGDVVKRRAEDMMSGIISAGKMKLTIEHTFTGQRLENVDSNHVRSAFDFEEDQYILFENRWVGQIDEVVQDITLRLSNNTLVQVDRPEFLELATNHGSAITDQSLFISDKFVVGQHVVATKSNLRRGKWILGEYTPEIEPNGIVVDVRTRYLTVNWVAQRYQGPGVPAVQFQIQPSTELYPEEDAVVVLADLSDATVHQIGDRVKFLERGVETEGYGGVRMDRRDFGGFDGNVWMVVGTETFVDVDWQDGTTSAEVPAKDLRMYLNIDEYEGWPGDCVSKTEPNGEIRFGIIQQVTPEERISRVRFFNEGTLLPEIEEISLYELHAHPIFQYSLGDHVLIAPKLLPPAGVIVEVVSMTAGFVEHIVRRMTDSEDANAAAPGLGEEVDWMGEIVRINIDGTVKVRLARETEPPPGWGGERYAVVKCGQLILIEEDEEDEEDVESIDVMGVDDVDGDDEDEWEDASEGTDEEIPQASLDGMSDVECPEEEMNDVNGITHDVPSPTSEIPDTIGVPATTASQLDQEKCAGFDILETVPDDHPFKNDVPLRTSPHYLSRIRKEHRILQTSLPDGILVRTYESRLDLMRVLILGPKNTPYENAPFLFDFSLGEEYPKEPPEAFFHSWTPGGTTGRVNPNLYVEGRVCLSLLGTWHSANDTESWNPKQSTLLQLFLSIQSLVLTPRPYYNEAGFTTHIGLNEASVNERLYSERAYFLSRGFVRFALENPVEGLASEIGYLYLDEAGPRLGAAVVEDARRVIGASEGGEGDDGEWERGRVTRISRGGLSILRRTVEGIEEVLRRENGV